MTFLEIHKHRLVKQKPGVFAPKPHPIAIKVYVSIDLDRYILNTPPMTLDIDTAENFQ